ncbi:glycoside hydrolase family 13 protein [Flavobacterium selenitireducens]|uniref:glycoside hydrolase family 13 protein n=1 Tax=Flavobacterium selenitireducens TaxID=2722704 RepID=UPI00168AF0DC|nr:glycoside hydrolase family 13 protein [Flavobacterium selenitireducens]MBD3583113.1 glycoside hydrolase family 13 protein [Flavobacterium selenitireducens]
MKQLLFLLLTVTAATAQLQKTEPPFWYANMKNPELQVMFYGKNINGFQVAVSNDIPVKDVTKTSNPNYLFVTIDTKNAAPGQITFTFSDNGKAKFTKKYELKARKKDSAARQGFDSSDLVYLIMPDRFANGNTKNDNTKDTKEKSNRTSDHGRHGGDIQGIIDNLDYIKNLGATAIWNTPLCEDNDERGSYHGYAQSDVYKIDPRYGTNEDYVKLSSELHKRDMKLILDYVTNHWGAEHWMIKDLPMYDWIHQFPGYGQSNYRMTTQFDPNTSERDKKYCVDGWFVRSMPDLNQANPLVVKYLTQNAIWWIEYADLDGFRVDTYSYCDKKGIADWTKAITDEYPKFNIVGEVWMHDQAQMAYWQKDSKIGAIQNYNSNLPSVMDFTLHDAIEAAFAEHEGTWDKGMIRMYDNFANDFLYPNINSILIFAENHDTQRFNQRYKDFGSYKMAMTLLATVRGIPQIYYGSEIGMAGDKGKGDGDIRRDFPGGWKADASNAFTAEGRSETQKKYFDFSSKLFNWRKSKSVIHTGKTMQFIPEHNVYVYFRYDDKETVMVVINNSDKPSIVKTERFAEAFRNFSTGKDVITGNSVNLKEDINIAPKSSWILELK